MHSIPLYKLVVVSVFVSLNLALYYHFVVSQAKVSASGIGEATVFKRDISHGRSFIVFSDDNYPNPGLRHLRTNFKCQITIAQLLNKTMIFPKSINIPEIHSASLLYPTQTEFLTVPIESVINVESLSLYFDVVSNDDLLIKQENVSVCSFLDLDVVQQNEYCCWQELCSYNPPPSSTKYSIKNVEENFHRHQHPQYLLDLSHELMKQIQPASYTAIHIRRGDKLNEERYANKLHRCTRPKWIRKQLVSSGISNGSIYIATNEYQSKFFHPLTQWYTVYTIRNFANSINETIRQNPYALVVIDEIIYSNAKVKLSTFIEPYTNISLCPFGRDGLERRQ